MDKDNESKGLRESMVEKGLVVDGESGLIMDIYLGSGQHR